MTLNKAIDAITEQDLLALVNQREPENKRLDYKATLNLDQEEPKAEFRRDVTSFANSVGGDLVIGIRDSAGIPKEVAGFELGKLSQEQYRLRILEVLQSRIKPRLQGVAIRPLQLSNGKWVTIIRIPGSFTKPHQVEVNNKDFQFWFRHDGGKQRMDIDEVRTAILGSESLAERVRNFRADGTVK
ncbi:MAG: ATP-binding protein [Chloroflexota bacterium]|nr:ATP-binding protein [Chloroflexota bacterium]